MTRPRTALPALAVLAVAALAVSPGLPAAASAPGAPATAPRAGVLDPGLPTGGGAPQQVVVTGTAGPEGLARAVRELGGRTGRVLPLVGGVEAELPAAALPALAARPGVTAVTADRTGTLTARSGIDESVSTSSFAWSTGAAPTWSTTDGRGVGVAVLDTGVAPVADLTGRLVAGPDLSGEDAPDRDSHGHGTVMAGIVAGDGTASGSAVRTGVAPGAHVVSVKVAGRDGSTDVSTVLAAMHWVSAFRAQYGIRVLNLSWGVPSTQDPAVDPLNHAVQRLWSEGVLVVVAAGNSGPSLRTVLKPADDPLVLTVGAYDDRGDADLRNDLLPKWTSRGPTAAGLAKPDLVAPGRTLVSTRAPGSQVELDNPSSLVAPAYVRGSGSSQAAAVVSGLAALLLAEHPGLTPDQAKAALVRSAVPIAGMPATGQGAGRVAVAHALAAATATAATVPATPTVTARGTGTLEASRGTSRRVQVRCGEQVRVLDDETTSWCAPWSGTSWTGTSWTGTSWTSDVWNGTSWTGTSWTGTSWTGTSWTGTSWTGTSWTGTSWTGTSWTSLGTDVDTDFLTAFFGDRPRWDERVAGETSEPVPAVCVRRVLCRS